jgi:hypothetical protein
MRVAVLISGQPSENVDCYNSIQNNIIKPYGADTFVVYPSDNHIISENETLALWNPTGLYYGKFPEIIPVNMRSLERYPKESETNVESLVKGLWGIYTANEIKQKYEQENGFRYDFVVRCRPDLLIHNRLELKRDGINIPIGWDHRGGYNDTFAYGDSKSMDWYAGLYHNLWHYANNQITIHPETFLKIHLQRGDFPIWRFHFPIRLRDMELSQLEYRQK